MHFWGQYSLLLQYEILEKLVTLMIVKKITNRIVKFKFKSGSLKVLWNKFWFCVLKMGLCNVCLSDSQFLLPGPQMLHGHSSFVPPKLRNKFKIWIFPQTCGVFFHLLAGAPGTLKVWETQVLTCCVFWPVKRCSARCLLVKIIFLGIYFCFFNVCDGKTWKNAKKMILTSEQHVEQLFAGQNTQHWCL